MVSGFNKKNKMPRKKEQFSIAKNPQQLVLGIVIFGVFLIKAGYEVFAYFNAQNELSNSTVQNANLATEASQGSDIQAEANDIYTQALDLKDGESTALEPIEKAKSNAVAQKKVKIGDDVDIMSSKNPAQKRGKTITVSISENGRMNPFLPEGENILPSSLGQTNLTFPPSTLVEGSDAGKVMETTISGILYDKYSPSAIININKTDYLVKKGDTINGYKILAIYKEQVVVKLGQNVYKAGVGELLELDKVNYNTIANLEKKFGGNNVTVSVKKKGY